MRLSVHERMKNTKSLSGQCGIVSSNLRGAQLWSEPTSLLLIQDVVKAYVASQKRSLCNGFTTPASTCERPTVSRHRSFKANV